MRPASDRCGDRFASGMSYPEVCLSGGDLLCLSGVLADEKVRKWILKASLYSSSCSTSDLQKEKTDS